MNFFKSFNWVYIITFLFHFLWTTAWLLLDGCYSTLKVIFMGLFFAYAASGTPKLSATIARLLRKNKG